VTISGESLVSHASGSPPGEELARLFIGMIRSCFVAPLLFSGPLGVAHLLHTYSNTPDLLTDLEHGRFKILDSVVRGGIDCCRRMWADRGRCVVVGRARRGRYPERDRRK
jgi:hypothetical protein